MKNGKKETWWPWVQEQWTKNVSLLSRAGPLPAWPASSMETQRPQPMLLALLQGGEHGTAALPMGYRHNVVPGELGVGAAGT